jgi:hypothetical protein
MALDVPRGLTQEGSGRRTGAEGGAAKMDELRYPCPKARNSAAR